MLSRIIKAIALLTLSVLLYWTVMFFLFSVLKLQFVIALALILLISFCLDIAFSNATKDLSVYKEIWNA